MYKNLYINGCSFTKGHLLDEDKTWPYLLGKKLNLPLNNKAANSNSMQTISDRTIMDLSNFLSPEIVHNKDTLVVIGLTWPGRQSVWFENTIINLTVNSLNVKQRKEKDFKNYALHRLGSNMSYSINNKISDIESNKSLLSENHEQPKDKYFNTIKKYYSYLAEWVKNDDNWHRNQIIKYCLNIINLQNYFNENNIDYLLVRFQPIHDTFNTDQYPDLKPLMDKIDRSKMVAFRDEVDDPDKINNRKLVMEKSHPNVYSCKIIAEDLETKIKEMYYE